MGRKNRMKSTFINTVHPGSMWICHARHGTLNYPEKIEKGDIALVLEVTDLGFMDSLNKFVKILSQKKGSVCVVSLEDFYFCYHKI